jgi:hypothetical protein
MRRRSFVLLIVPFLLASISCSVLSESNPILDETLVSITNKYLTDISNGRGRDAAAMILWADYGTNTRNGLTPEQYILTVDKMRRHKPSAPEHPLRGLEVKDVDFDDDSGAVTLRHPKSGDKVIVQMLWTGSGWLITRDNLFGKDGYLSSYL